MNNDELLIKSLIESSNSLEDLDEKLIKHNVTTVGVKQPRFFKWFRRTPNTVELAIKATLKHNYVGDPNQFYKDMTKLHQKMHFSNEESPLDRLCKVACMQQLEAHQLVIKTA